MVGSGIGSGEHARSVKTRNITKQKSTVRKEVSVFGRLSRDVISAESCSRTNRTKRALDWGRGCCYVYQSTGQQQQGGLLCRSERAKRLGRHPLPRSHPSACLVLGRVTWGGTVPTVPQRSLNPHRWSTPDMGRVPDPHPRRHGNDEPGSGCVTPERGCV